MNLLMNDFLILIKKEINGIKTIFFKTETTNQMKFYKGDEVVYNNPWGQNGNNIAHVLRYNPSDINADKRLLIKLQSTNEEIWINPSLVNQVNYQIETRERLHIFNNDPIFDLHKLLNEFIIVEPPYQINETIDFTMSSLKISKIIIVPKMGFIYLGNDFKYNLRFAVAQLKSTDHKYYLFGFPIKEEMFQLLMEYESIDFNIY